MVITSYVYRLDNLTAKKIVIDSGEKSYINKKHNKKKNIKPFSLIWALNLK